MCLNTDIIRLKIIVFLLALTRYVNGGDNIDDDNCEIRFYAVKQFQGAYWTSSQGNKSWSYEENGHPYTVEHDIADWKYFVAKSIRTLASKPERCKRWEICSKKKSKRGLCKTLPSGSNKFPDITNMKIGRHQMKQWRISVIHKRTNLGCIGTNCSGNISEDPVSIEENENDRISSHPPSYYTSPLNNSSLLTKQNISESTQNKTGTSTNEASGFEPENYPRILFYFLIGKITTSAIVVFITGIGVFTCITLCKHKYTHRLRQLDSTRFSKPDDGCELLQLHICD